MKIRKLTEQLALKSIHNENIAHRDLKSENILLDENLDVKFCDFGCCCTLNPGKLEISNPEEPIGSFEFNAPELHKEHVSYDPVKSDIFSIGCILFQTVSFPGK